jgi:predicted DNA binding protein
MSMTAPSDDKELLSVAVDVWHPDCWGITSTDTVGNGIVGHGAAVEGDSGYERVTIHGNSREHVAQAIEVAHDTPFIKTIEPLGEVAKKRSLPSIIGQSAQDAFIEYDATEGIGSAFLSRGYVLDSTYRVEAGTETWEMLVYTTRESFRRSLDEIQEERDADISLKRLSPAASGHNPNDRDRAPELTPRQKEAIELARARGYYQWPRGVSADELAAELGVSKVTFLEHLRKAEAKLLGGQHEPSERYSRFDPSMRGED